MRKAYGDEELSFVVRIQFDTERLSKCRRAHPQIHSNIEDAPDRTTNEFRHRRPHILIVESPQNLICRAGVRVLHELERQSCIGKIFLVPRFDEETAIVAEEVNVNDQKAC